MRIIIGPEKGEPQTINLSLQAMGVAQFRMRLHNQTLDEVTEDLLLAQLDPKKAKEMAMESLTYPWGADS